MTPAEAIKILDLLPHSTPEQIEARFVEQRALLEDKAARALTPKLQAQYREALGRVTEAYEALVLAEESATLPSLTSASEQTAEAPAVTETAAAAAVDSFGPWVMRQLGGMLRGGLAVIAGSMLTFAFDVALEEHHLVLPNGVEPWVFELVLWLLVAGLPGLAWWIYAVRTRRRAALRKLLPAGSTQPERCYHAWFFALLTVSVVALARYYVYLVQQDERVAKEWYDRALGAEKKDDWAGVVAAYGQARGLRPYNDKYKQLHEMAQKVWLDGLETQLPRQTPDQAFAALARDAVRPRLWLTSPTRERYQKLYGQTTGRFHEAMEKDLAEVGVLIDQGKLPEARALVEKLRPGARLSPAFPAAVEQVDAAEFDLLLAPAREAESKEDYQTAYALLEKLPVKDEAARQRLRKAIVMMHFSQFMQFWQQSGGLLQKGEFFEAQDKLIDLEAIAQRITGLDGYAGVAKDMDGLDLAGMIANVRRGWRTELVRRTVAELVEALATSDAPRAQDILVGYAALQGYASPVTGEALVKEKFFPQFLDYLAILNLRTISPGEPDSISCLALVQAALPHFTKPEPARQFLAAGYHRLAEWGLKNEVPGLALYLLRESVRAGGAADEALEAATLQLLAENRPVRIAFPAIAPEAENATALAENLHEMIKAALEKASRGMLLPANDGAVDEESPRAFVLKGVLTGISAARGQRNEKKTVSYPTGEKQVMNPAAFAKRAEIQIHVKKLQDQISTIVTLTARLDDMKKTGDKKAISAEEEFLSAMIIIRDGQKRRIAELQQQLRDIPQNLTQVTFAEQPYEQVTHHRNHAASLQLRLGHGALPDGGKALAGWDAALRYSTVDVTGEIQRGVPVQQAVFLTDAEVEERLKQDLTAKITAQMPALLWQLAHSIRAAKLAQEHKDSSRGRLSGDTEWGWVAFWEKCGVSLPTAAAEAAAREDLGLPSLATVAERPFVPPAGWQAENSLGMRFSAVPGTQVLFSIWETRVQDFATFINATKHAATGGMHSLTADGWVLKGASWRNPGFAQDATHPVCGISWNDAKAFCAWLTQKERAAGNLAQDREYRLPTFAEWNQVAGVAAEAAWPQVGAGNLAGLEVLDGNCPADFKILAGYADGFARTAPVGWFSSNALGIYDLEGNVAEWCQPDGQAMEGVPVPTLGSSYVTAESETGGKEPRRAQALPEMRNCSQGFRVVIAPVENK